MEFFCAFAANAAVGLSGASSCLGAVPNESFTLFLMEKTRSSLSLYIPESQLQGQFNESISYIKTKQQRKSI